MEPDDTPGEGTERIEYEAPRIIERAAIEAQFSIVVST